VLLTNGCCAGRGGSGTGGGGSGTGQGGSGTGQGGSGTGQGGSGTGQGGSGAGRGAFGAGRGAFGAGREALRWVTDAAVTMDGGAIWPRSRVPGAPLSDDLYAGTAGVLAALAEARLSGIAEFDVHAEAAAGRLRSLSAPDSWAGFIAEPDDSDAMPECPDFGLYTGLSGCATALHIWASVSAYREAGAAARSLMNSIADVAATGQPVSTSPDLLSGEAGVLLAVVDIGGGDHARRAASIIADRIVAGARWVGGEPDWPRATDNSVFTPNFSHGAAGIGYALAAASAALDRPDLLDVALAAGRRLVRLGTRPDGTLAVPYSVQQPQETPDAPVSYGWCHGPTGTLRLFEVLDLLRPGQGWSQRARASRRSVRASGLPERLYPGFWDNLGQCCGTAGVGEMALDRYQETSDPRWLEWATTLAADVLDRSVSDRDGTRWSHTEHRRAPSGLEPEVGWMQGAAGIGGWLQRLARVTREGPAAARIHWPDRYITYSLDSITLS
jgi:lantibiotic modifying enzyme